MLHNANNMVPAGKISGWDQLISELYAHHPVLKMMLVQHSRMVARLALALNARLANPLDSQLVKAAAMLHDIGIIHTNAPSIFCRGTEPYIRHGVIGAEILRRAGFDERLARVAERHTGTGLTLSDIQSQRLPLPTDVDLMPRSRLERLICYADKFYSKSSDSRLKSIDEVRHSLARHSAETLARFEALVAEFGEPDPVDEC